MSNVTHPTHYNSGKIEVIEAIEDWQLGFHLGNAVKYVARAGKKDPNKKIEDLQKAIWYIQRQIEIEGDSPRRPNDMNPRADITVPEKLKVSSMVECIHEWHQVGPMEAACTKCQSVAKS